MKTKISETFFYADLDAVLLEGLLLVTQFNFSTFVIMHNHCNKKVVNFFEQLTELSKVRVMP